MSTLQRKADTSQELLFKKISYASLSKIKVKTPNKRQS
jgi:hypothetical protein